MTSIKEKKHKRTLQPHSLAKIIGIILIIVGLIFLINPTIFFIKLSFAAILIGIFMILLITEQTVPRKISEAQIEGNLSFIKKMTKELKLDGNAVFLPKSQTLKEERVYIPVKKTNNTSIPPINDELVFSKALDGSIQGISVPPSGLNLLKEIQTEISFNDSTMEDIEEKLQTFVGMNILKSITLKKIPNGYKLELEHYDPCSTEQSTCTQYPCSACSAVITPITQAAKQKIHVLEETKKGAKNTFLLKIGEL